MDTIYGLWNGITYKRVVNNGKPARHTTCEIPSANAKCQVLIAKCEPNLLAKTILTIYSV